MKLAIIFMVLLCAGLAAAFEVTSPQDAQYNGSLVDLSVVHNETLDNIEYSLDGSNLTLACENCSSYNATLNLSEGNHTIAALGNIGNVTYEERVNFSVVLPVPVEYSFSLNIVQPPLNVTSNMTPIEVLANRTVESMNILVLNGSALFFNASCTNCNAYYSNVSLNNGSYYLLVHASNGNISKNESKAFNVSFIAPAAITNITNTTNTTANITTNVTNQTTNKSGNYTSRYAVGFEKLPQAVAAGELTDAELAQIIRTNKLNPGVINRLIKTGRLGNESINAILDYQKQPWGIFQKLFRWIGFRQQTYSSLIYENYNVSDDVAVKLAKRPDIPKGYERKIIDDEKRKGIDITNTTLPPGQAKKQDSQSDNLPPGQAKKQSNDAGKLPPGQAKKDK